ncbi:hypothetical protein HALLA_00230 (plasmid) [Halostagnicola larsenii XH-48]|uniref:Uncharacterized protein n=1 Tax=Halostagnicola larsenii XH-48 TaxID=797299 RepID=W0JWZ2_9EURY|nr:hypothetical protein HALLA_00230 [Halostagnicola larsenii XH-48]
MFTEALVAHRAIRYHPLYFVKRVLRSDEPVNTPETRTRSGNPERTADELWIRDEHVHERISASFIPS